MTLAQLISQFRTYANDKVQPYFWSDEEVTIFLNEAQVEAAIRGRLIHESSQVDVCKVAVAAPAAVYPLHEALYELTHAAFKDADGKGCPSLIITSTEEMDHRSPEWRDDVGDPRHLIQNDIDVRLVPAPERDGELTFEGYRLPMEAISLANKDDDTPEINGAHHPHLIQWALFRAFSIPDTEVFDPNRASQAEFRFTQYFGIRPDSDLRRITREDVPHTVKAHWV